LSSDLLASCLRVARAGDCILLIEDGAYNVRTLADAATAQGCDLSQLQCCVLRDDLSARGFSESALPAFITAVDHAGFVALACAHRQSVHWF
jgi:sulfur relay protein TusB/DsrH